MDRRLAMEMKAGGPGAAWTQGIFLWALAGCLAVAGCDCSESSEAIFIVRPADGAELTLADDADSDPSNGFQIE
ncbi:MAG: hypothetical protein ACODAU_11780, partial [Myxococcota bacterium]